MGVLAMAEVTIADLARAHPVYALEAAALTRWCQGDPSGFIALADPEVSYFDPFLPGRVDGLPALTAYYASLRGKVGAQSWDILEPRVVEVGSVAILTFRFRSVDGAATIHRWNATEVYRQRGEAWRLTHTHWSFTGARG